MPSQSAQCAPKVFIYSALSWRIVAQTAILARSLSLTFQVGQNMSIDNTDSKSEIKKLITKGREQGYLTYAEVNDHLPDDIIESEQLEDIIAMINDMGIEVHEVAPDAESLILSDSAPAGSNDDDTAAEEAVAALSALDSEAGRTTDPVRMYMREMGTVDLLDRAGEIAIAKRIEEGLGQVQAALASFPWSIQLLLEEYDQHVEGKKRLSEVVQGFTDIEEPEAEAPPEIDVDADVVDVDTDDTAEGDDEGVAETGPDPAEVARRMEALKIGYDKFRKAHDKLGPADRKTIAAREEMAAEFLRLKLPAIQIDGLVRKLREVINAVRNHERVVSDICIRLAKMPRRDFLRVTPSSSGSPRVVK